MLKRISIHPDVCHGQACVKGTRMPVYQVVGMLANGDTIEGLLEDYPSLEREDILACLSYAADLAEELDVRGTPDQGIDDSTLWRMAQEGGRLLITTDKGFA